MPFYLEYKVRGDSEVRSAVPGETAEEAIEASTDTLKESGCTTALLRRSAEPDTTIGSGDVVATYVVPSYGDTGGWEIL